MRTLGREFSGCEMFTHWGLPGHYARGDFASCWRQRPRFLSPVPGQRRHALGHYQTQCRGAFGGITILNCRLFNFKYINKNLWSILSNTTSSAEAQVPVTRYVCTLSQNPNISQAAWSKYGYTYFSPPRRDARSSKNRNYSMGQWFIFLLPCKEKDE